MMTAAPPLTIAELEHLLRAANPGAILLPPRRLRRVIKEDRAISGLGLQVPHRQSYTISRDRLLHLAPREELGQSPEQHLPTTLLLLVRPEPAELDDQPRDRVLRGYWRLLFHARVHALLERRLAEGRLPSAVIAERVRCIGRAVFSEIRLVLEQEHYLLPPTDEPTIYVECAALYLELRAFAPHLLPVYFPSMDDVLAMDAMFAEDVGAAELLAETRPAGAAEAVDSAADSETEQPAYSPAALPVEECRALAARAERAEGKGNVVRAARLHQRAGDESSARVELDRLAKRLRAALGLDEAAMARWRAAIEPLLRPASCGVWPVEARLLYDLQKVCIDRERAVYAVDTVEWVYTLGRRPIQRLLPGHAEVLQLKHLRSAARRAAAARMPAGQRQRLEVLLHEAVAKAEHSVRELFRPRVAEVLSDVGMRPTNLPERVALNKLTEELLDRVIERGYLNMGDLRDAVSRNNLRLPDLSGPKEFFRGDRLIRANRRLPVLLEGVYRRGEFYLRWLQRLSSVAFGTATGRALVLYLLLPFGGAFLTLEGLQHIVAFAAKLMVGEGEAAAEAIEGGSIAVPEPAPERFHFASPAATVILGCFLFGLIHSATFRGWVAQAILVLGRGLRLLFMDVPTMVLNLAVIRRLLTNWPVVWFGRYVARPAAAGLLVGLLGLLAMTAREAFVAGAAAFVAGCFFFNSRLASELEAALLDWLSSVWLRLQIELVPALFHFVMAMFKSIVEAIDRMLYTVDEWLRFRTGESRYTFAWKLVLGSLWFLVSYVVRLYVNLFIEPTTNPIKHIPVVTVAAKIMAPFTLILFHAIRDYLDHFMNHALADAVAALHVLILPGVFGFLAWELKANWRLYRSNQPKTLRPDMIGHHGETLHGLLKPGFHSGTVPKLYRKLRRAERRDDATMARKQHEALHHVAEAVRHFTERELVYLLELSRSWGAMPFRAGRVALGCTSIRVELRGAEVGADSAWVIFEEQARSLEARVERWGWLKTTSETSRQALAAALGGWYQMAAAEHACGQPACGGTPISWQSWVDAWERDRRGEGVPQLP